MLQRSSITYVTLNCLLTVSTQNVGCSPHKFMLTVASPILSPSA